MGGGSLSKIRSSLASCEGFRRAVAAEADARRYSQEVGSPWVEPCRQVSWRAERQGLASSGQIKFSGELFGDTHWLRFVMMMIPRFTRPHLVKWDTAANMGHVSRREGRPFSFRAAIRREKGKFFSFTASSIPTLVPLVLLPTPPLSSPPPLACLLQPRSPLLS